MIRFSLVIQNGKGEFLVCETDSTSAISYFEFPGGDYISDELPPFDVFLQDIQDFMLRILAIEICDLERLEMYYREDPFFAHTIFSASIKSGTPETTNYKSLQWIPLSDLESLSFNEYGLHVFQKLSECGYCHFLHNRQDELDSFFEAYFSKAEENLSILNILENEEVDPSVYLLAFKQEVVHLRASLIENTKLRKNITIQNYLRLYGRDDLASRIDELLKIQVNSDLSLREMIKVTVDKFIAHYDKPTETDRKIYDYCISIFSVDGKLPLKRFVNSLNGFIMSLIVQMWYDAGELGVQMSERCMEDEQAIIDFGNTFLSEITEAFQNQ